MATSQRQSIATEMARGCDLLVRNGYLVTMDQSRTIYPAGAIAIDGGTIIAVGLDRDLTTRLRPKRTIDARGGVIHPGLIEAHYHATLHLSRGAITDDPNDSALGHRRIGGGDEETNIATYSKWFNCLDDEDEHVASLITCVELVRNGYTCFMEAGTVFEPSATAAAAEAVGIRALVADPFLWDYEGIDQMTREISRAPAETDRCLKMLGGQLWRNTNADALVRGYICLYGAGTCTDELTRAAKICADNNGVVFAQHQNFLMDDTAGDDARFGRHAVTHFSELGLLSENTTFVHMNVLRDDEVRAVVASGMSLVWHPGNYMFYGLSGQTRCRMPELWRQGVNLTLGTDAAKAWTFGDLGLIAYLVARQTGEFLPAENILEMVTIGAAKAVGLADRIGSLEVGKRADVVIRSQALPECLPFLAPIREMVLVSRSKSVDTVIVNGEVVVRAGRLTRLDEGPVYDAARLWSRRMVDRVGLNLSVPWPVVD